MGKNAGKKKLPQGGVKFSSQSFRHSTDESFIADAQEGRKFSSKSFRYAIEGSSSQGDEDPDTATFIELSQELREEGNRFFQRRDHCGALLSYQKALKLLPENHHDIANLRTNMAACYMQMGVNEYPRAINECNCALQVVPHYSKALLKRARCYMDLDRFDLALMDIDSVLEYEPDNIIALDLRDSLINEIVQLEAEFEEEQQLEAVAKKKRSKKKKKKNAKADEDGENVTENSDVQDQIVLEKDEVVVSKSNDFANGIKDEDTSNDFATRRVEVENEKAETSEAMAECHKVERTATNEEDVMVNRRAAMNEEKKTQVTRNVVSEEAKADTRAAVNEEKKSQLRRFVKEEAKAVTRNAASDEKKLEIRTVVSEDKKAEMMLKLVCGEDIRRAVLPLNSNIFMLRDKVKSRFRSLKGVVMKYKDHEGDLITITTTEDLRIAETYVDSTGCLRLYIIGVEFEAEPVYEDEVDEEEMRKAEMTISNETGISSEVEDEEEESSGSEELETSSESDDDEDVTGQSTGVDRWIRQFARLLKNNVGFNSDSNLELHEAGMKLYSEAMEQTVTSEEAHSLLENASGKFQEMAALAAFNWGNVYMTKAKKKVTISEDESRDSVLEQAKIAFEWAQQQYENARIKYQLAVKFKPDFYEGFIALGYQQFEQAKLTWYYALANDFDMESGPSSEILDLYNKAEESMEKGVVIWEELDQKRPNVDRMGKNGHLRTLSTDEFADPASIMRSQIYVLWGALLYERSVVEYKMGIPVWAECLEVAVEKFELAGASQTDIAVMVKNHCSNVNALEGLEFKIDEIVQAWNEMHDAKRWQFSEPAFRLEPLFRRQSPKLLEILEHIGCSFIED